MIASEAIETALRQAFAAPGFPQAPAGLYDPLRYMVAIGGKRIRPRLCLLSWSLYRDTLGEEILQPAAGLEIFHTFTLIHDDLMDRSPLRRGQETVWKRWNSDTAILSGDVMFIDSYRRMGFAPRELLGDVLRLFTQTAAEVCEGQQMDMDFEKADAVPMADYMQMIGLKTGVLIACAAEMGALIAGAPAADCRALYRYGYDLGLAFQVADDYPDAYGDTKLFGKPIGGDIVNNKKSWLFVRTMEKASPAGRKALSEAMAMPAEAAEEKIARVMELYAGLSIEADAHAEILRLSELSLSHVADFAPEARQLLSGYADSLIGRTV